MKFKIKISYCLYAAKLLPVYYWPTTGLLLAYYWPTTGLLLVYCWSTADTDNLIVTEVLFYRKQNLFNDLISSTDWVPSAMRRDGATLATPMLHARTAADLLALMNSTRP